MTLALLTGCSGGAADPSGIWLIQVAYDADAGVVCDSALTENFEEGYVPDEDVETEESDWSFEQSTTGSDSLMFVQVETTTANAGVLLMGGETLPGTFDGKTWTFTWTDSAGTEERTEHSTGYQYTESQSSASDITVKLIAGKGGVFTGEYTASSSDAYEWSESDEYDDDVADYIGSSGQIPSSSYLVYEDQDGDERSQYNEQEEDDCEGDDCRLATTSTCAGTNTFTASRADYADEDAFSYLQSY